MNRAVAYLQGSPDTDGEGSGLPRWSAGGEALEWCDGSTTYFAAEVALFLEGYASVGPLIHFDHVVGLMMLLDNQRPGEGTPSEAISQREWDDVLRAMEWSQRVREAGRPLRNAGALCARICRDLIPPIADPPDPKEVGLLLSDGMLRGVLAVYQGATSRLASGIERAAFGSDVLESRFFAGLGKLSPEEVDHWLRHGHGPAGDAGEEIAEAVAAFKPPAEGGPLAALELRERLAGAAPMVAQLVGALALPPRRRAESLLPTGGYADVSNRGAIDRILPGQLAVDPDEFVRRFAENELLFFHREEPHAPVGEDLVILLDQGVRCWGRVRLVLAASALALGKMAQKRKMPWRIGGTSNQGLLLDPDEVEAGALGTFWEASDLSADPSLALEHVLEQSSRDPGPRDVVVLSHPRSVAAPGFAAVARRTAASTRLFSVVADDSGRVALAEWRRGAAITIAAFRVEPRRVPVPPAATKTDPLAWSGDVEPVGYPFRLGAIHPIEGPTFDFDHDGRRLMLAVRGGTLHAWSLDGSSSEVLPRGLIEGEPLARVEAVLGVADGFVTCGRMGGGSLAAVHYDFGTRAVRSYALGSADDEDWQWFYLRNVHTVVARGEANARAVDLSNREAYRLEDRSPHPSNPANRAFRLASGHSVPPPRLAVVDEGNPRPDRGGFVTLDRRSGAIQLERVEPAWIEFTPMTDGRPTLQGAWIDQAQLRGDVLALQVSAPDRPARVLLFRGPSGVPLREAIARARPGPFQLGAEGRLLAQQLNDRQILVQATYGTARPVFVTPRGESHNAPEVTLGPMGMAVRVGGRVTLIGWGSGRLASWSAPGDASTPKVHGAGRDPGPLVVPASRTARRPAALSYDPARFVACARATLTAVVDHFGQIALFAAGDRLVAMLLVSRGQVAAWMPDGTRLGPPSMIDEADADPAPATEAIGRALLEASRKDRA